MCLAPFTLLSCTCCTPRSFSVFFTSLMYNHFFVTSPCEATTFAPTALLICDLKAGFAPYTPNAPKVQRNEMVWRCTISLLRCTMFFRSSIYNLRCKKEDLMSPYLQYTAGFVTPLGCKKGYQIHLLHPIAFHSPSFCLHPKGYQIHFVN